jgi:hypothetical protein
LLRSTNDENSKMYKSLERKLYVYSIHQSNGG